MQQALPMKESIVGAQPRADLGRREAVGASTRSLERTHHRTLRARLRVSSRPELRTRQ